MLLLPFVYLSSGRDVLRTPPTRVSAPALAAALRQVEQADSGRRRQRSSRTGCSRGLGFVFVRILPRDLLVGVTYVVVIFSIIVQGLSIGPLVKKLGLSTGEAPAAGSY